MLAKNQRHTVTITGWSAEGLGVARIGGGGGFFPPPPPGGGGR